MLISADRSPMNVSLIHGSWEALRKVWLSGFRGRIHRYLIYNKSVVEVLEADGKLSSRESHTVKSLRIDSSRQLRAVATLLAALFFSSVLLAATSAPNPQSALEATPGLPTLTTAAEAHNLSTQEAGRGYPVHLRGVVTSIDPSTPLGHAAVFLHDATGSVYVMLADAVGRSFPAGTVIDVQGVTDPGSFAPIIEHTHVRAIGRLHLPEDPPLKSFSQLASGTADGEWVAVEGIVHSVIHHLVGDSQATNRYVTLQLAMRDGTVGVSMLYEPGADYARLVDAKVRIEANAAPMFNRNDQVMGARLMAPGLSTVRVLETAPSDPFQNSITQIDDLLRWDQLAAERHRVHVRGRVTMLWPGSSFCIRDESRGICAQTKQETHLALGEVADVVGFVAAENGTPVLTDAVYKSAGRVEPVVPRPVTADQALLGKVVISQVSRTDYDSELIQVEGQLIGNDQTSADTTLLMNEGQTVFTAILPKTLMGTEKNSWKVGSRLRVTGICSVQLDTTSRVAGGGVASAKSFRVLMRTPDDIVVLERPSWWTPAHALLVLALAFTLTLVVLAWVVVLSQRLEQRTVLLRESEERFRHMALHDALTGLATRILLDDRLNAAMETARRNRSALGLLMVDLDKFKEINDTYGHHGGDEVLRVTAERLQDAVRKSDTVARMGGDEFLVLLSDLRDVKMAERIAANIVASLSIPVPFDGKELAISVSVGVCTASAGEQDADALLRNVDAALYRAKAKGRNCFEVFREDQTSGAESIDSAVL